MEQMKPCPFCGGEVVIRQHPIDGSLYIFPMHKKRCPFWYLNTWLLADKPIKKQIKLWNRRYEEKES